MGLGSAVLRFPRHQCKNYLSPTRNKDECFIVKSHVSCALACAAEKGVSWSSFRHMEVVGEPWMRFRTAPLLWLPKTVWEAIRFQMPYFVGISVLFLLHNFFDAPTRGTFLDLFWGGARLLPPRWQQRWVSERGRDSDSDLQVVNRPAMYSAAVLKDRGSLIGNVMARDRPKERRRRSRQTVVFFLNSKVTSWDRGVKLELLRKWRLDERTSCGHTTEIKD